jgi:hypothetical protein
MKKKLILGLSLVALSINAFCQMTINESATESPRDKNEVRLNVATAIAGLPELNYERFITDNMGVGLALSIALDKPRILIIRNIALPYYRVYFGEKQASGFFIEGNMAIVGQKKAVYGLNANEDGYNSATNFGCGAAVGFKLLNRNGVTGEICLGGGRLFGGTLEDGYPRLGICLGKRF